MHLGARGKSERKGGCSVHFCALKPPHANRHVTVRSHIGARALPILGGSTALKCSCGTSPKAHATTTCSAAPRKCISGPRSAENAHRIDGISADVRRNADVE
eukprot:3435236-Rhodomonas_salina.1